MIMRNYFNLIFFLFSGYQYAVIFYLSVTYYFLYLTRPTFPYAFPPSQVVVTDFEADNCQIMTASKA